MGTCMYCKIIIVSFSGIYAVIIVDPAIKVMSTYQPFEEGLGMDIFIKVNK